MRTMSYTESRARYAEVRDSVVSLSDFEALRETAYLMRAPVAVKSTLWLMTSSHAAGLGPQ